MDHPNSIFSHLFLHLLLSVWREFTVVSKAFFLSHNIFVGSILLNGKFEDAVVIWWDFSKLSHFASWHRIG